VPGRLAVLVALAWAVLAGFGWSRLSPHWAGRPWLRRGFFAALCLFVLLEACSLPLPWLHIRQEAPEAYQFLAQLPQGTVVAELPMMGHNDDNARDARYLYWSTHHQKTLINGYSGYFSQAYTELAQKAARPSRTGYLPDIYAKGARYLVFHAAEYPAGDRQWQINKFARTPEISLVLRTDRDLVYQLLPPPAAAAPAAEQGGRPH
jgi:hypothetical protein